MQSFYVLVVDDEEDFLNSIVKRLNLRNLYAHGVKSGEAALEHMGKNHVDVVVLDIKMPSLDGLRTLEEIKIRHPSIEVIMLTGHASVESNIEGLNLGAFDYIIKPVRLNKLMDKIMEAYEHKQAVHKKADPNPPDDF